MSQLWGVTGVVHDLLLPDVIKIFRQLWYVVGGVHDRLLPDVVQIFRELWYVVGGVHDHIAGGHGSRDQQTCQPPSAKIIRNIRQKEKRRKTA